MSAGLPEGFEDLEPVAARWALPSQRARSQQRWAASPADFQAAYDALWPRLPDMLSQLDRQPLDEMDGPHQRLLQLALALAELAPHVELYKGAAQVPNSFENKRFVADHDAWVAGGD